MSGTGTLQQVASRILVITRDAEVKGFVNNLMILKRIQAGMTESIENAYQFLSSNPSPDVVILDLDLSEERGVEFLKQVRRLEKLARVPVLVLTSFPDPTLVRQALDAGANRYLTKMFMSQNFLTTIQEIIRQVPPPPPAPRQTASLRS